jgi:hypothetical protein
MKTKILVILLPVFILFVTAAWSAPATLEGQIQGYNCVVQGKPCPVGKEDPTVAVEETFVLLTPDGKYYFVPNVPMRTMARHITQQARVTGDMDPKYNAVRATNLEVNMNGQWKTVWNSSWVFQER